MSEQPTNLTSLLVRMRAGDRDAGEIAMRVVYTELHRLAVSYMRGESPDHTLQPTALLHEACLRMLGGEELEIQDRGHFKAMVAQAMRRVLVDHARAKRAEKRGSGGVKVEVAEEHAAAAPRDLDVIALDQALEELARLDARAAKVVELRYFGGYTDKEVCETLNQKMTTIRRDWDFARAWLRTRLS